MIHGGDIYSRRVELDFSANINPLGMPANVRTALRAGVRGFEAYPDPECRALRRAIAEREAVDPANIVCGSGASDLIYRLARVLSPKKALVTAPAFSEYEKALLEAGARVERFRLKEENDFRLDDGILGHIPERGAVFLSSPNNPDGGMIDRPLLEKIISECRQKRAAFVLDQCFADFARTRRGGLPRPPIALKAFTKIYAMAGLRLGYLVCEDASVAAKIAASGPCWSVSSPAQTAGLAALKESTFVPRTRRFIAHERDFLSGKLAELGLRVFPSEVNYLLFKGPIGLDAALLRRGIAIRGCADYHGLGPEFYRTAVRTRAENEILVRTMGEILSEGK